MLKAALLALALLGGAPAASTPLPAAADVAWDQFTVIRDMTGDYGIFPRVTWVPCGMENAYYFPDTGAILLCLELSESPGAVFVAAHEAGHAIAVGLDIDVDDRHEDAADELAALALIEQDRLDDLVGGAMWFMSMGLDGGDDGDHSSNRARARKLLCLADGADNGSFACVAYLASVKAKWNRRLAPHWAPVFDYSNDF